MKRLPLKLTLFVLLAFAVAGCGGAGGQEGGGSADLACERGNLVTAEPGVLTIATDRPSYPPYFIGDDPANGKGFESALAYAIAARLGYPEAKVKWTAVPFNVSYAPGPKQFDFDINQISVTPQREKSVDFSVPYYTASQAVVALEGSDAAAAGSLAELAETRFGVQVGTTSLAAVEEEIAPSEEPRVFESSNEVVMALRNGVVDAVVVDLPTAIYLTTVQVPAATVVGQFSASGGDQWGALLAKDSPLTACVSAAIEALDESGELERLNRRWMSEAVGAPRLD